MTGKSQVVDICTGMVSVANKLTDILAGPRFNQVQGLMRLMNFLITVQSMTYYTCTYLNTLIAVGGQSRLLRDDRPQG